MATTTTLISDMHGNRILWIDTQQDGTRTLNDSATSVPLEDREDIVQVVSQWLDSADSDEYDINLHVEMPVGNPYERCNYCHSTLWPSRHTLLSEPVSRDQVVGGRVDGYTNDFGCTHYTTIYESGAESNQWFAGYAEAEQSLTGN